MSTTSQYGVGAMRSPAGKRRKYFVDPQVQGAILRQALWYWLCGSVTYTLVVVLFRIAPHWLAGDRVEFARILYHLAPMFVSSVALLPFMLISAVRFSHRFVGPMIRFRRVLDRLAQGEAAPLIRLRQDDFWRDVADRINRVSARLSAASAEASVTEKEGSESQQLIACP